MPNPLDKVVDDANQMDFSKTREATMNMVNSAEEGEPADQANAEPTGEPADIQGDVPEDNSGDDGIVAEQDPALAAQQAIEDTSAIIGENEALKAENERLKALQEQTSNDKEVNLVEEALMPPVLDIEKIMYLPDEERMAAQQKYSQDMADYSQKRAMKDFEPLLADYNANKMNVERQASFDAIEKMDGYGDVKQHADSINHLIQTNEAIKNMTDPVQQALTAYLIAKGLDTTNQKEPTAEDLFNKYKGNKDFRDLVEKDRAENLRQHQQVPILPTSNGVANVALNVPEKPKTFGEASALLRKKYENQ